MCSPHTQALGLWCARSVAQGREPGDGPIDQGALVLWPLGCVALGKALDLSELPHPPLALASRRLRGSQGPMLQHFRHVGPRRCTGSTQ